VPEWMVPAAGLGGAMLVAVANFLVQRWRYKLDRISNSIDHFCDQVNDVADLSTRYWLLDAADSAAQKEVSTLEPQLVGRQMRLQSLILALAELDRKIILIRSQMLLVDLYESLTGGDFKVLRRRPSPDRAQTVQALAAQINGELRHAVSLRSQKWF
jgi:hypothetical protein